MPVLNDLDSYLKINDNAEPINADRSYFLEFDRVQCNITRFCETASPKITITDTRDLIDIVSKLQNIYQVSAILSILPEFEKLLKIKRVSLGVYDAESNQNSYVVGAFKKNIVPELQASLRLKKELNSFYSIHEKFMVFSESRNDRLCGYMCFQSEANYLTDRQRQMFRFVLPYLYCSVYKLHHISNILTELNLTTREQEVMEWIKEGKDNWAISRILGISERTIKFHNRNIFRKIGASSRTEAICWYYRFISSLNNLFNINKNVSEGFV